MTVQSPTWEDVDIRALVAEFKDNPDLMADAIADYIDAQRAKEVKAEREACAKIAEEEALVMDFERSKGARTIATLIRNRQ